MSPQDALTGFVDRVLFWMLFAVAASMALIGLVCGWPDDDSTDPEDCP